MWTWIAITGGGLVATAFGLWLFLLVTMRTGYGPGLSVIRRFNRRFMNRRAMKTAGEPGAYAAVIRHLGRTTATPYETPVGVVEAEEGFVIALPYGTSPDWLKNVQAAGSAVLVHEGRTIPVREPALVPASQIAPQASRWDRFVQRLYGVDLYLRLTRDEARVGEHA